MNPVATGASALDTFTGNTTSSTLGKVGEKVGISTENKTVLEAAERENFKTEVSNQVELSALTTKLKGLLDMVKSFLSLIHSVSEKVQ